MCMLLCIYTGYMYSSMLVLCSIYVGCRWAASVVYVCVVCRVYATYMADVCVIPVGVLLDLCGVDVDMLWYVCLFLDVGRKCVCMSVGFVWYPCVCMLYVCRDVDWSDVGLLWA